MTTYDDMISALDDQAKSLAEALRDADLAASTSIDGWSTGMLLGHLTRGLAAVADAAQHQTGEQPAMDLVAWAAVTEQSAQQLADGVKQQHADPDELLHTAQRCTEALRLADPDQAVVLGGRPTLSLQDSLRTRCVELAVHGLDFIPPVEPSPSCAAVASETLLRVLAERHPGTPLTLTVAGLPPLTLGAGDRSTVTVSPVTWLRLATGRLSHGDARLRSDMSVEGPDTLDGLLPLVS
ncbi:MAG: hypothetical protein QOI42_360 [Frankiaceae bacterium]|jgi:uncharacterized protein (TIGR03083 family)|nr:hypothetical protein [Frankiaceae bacterium]